jgi:hypothetical protein
MSPTKVRLEVGDIVEKINSDPVDIHKNRAQGRVVKVLGDGSMGYGYFVIWNDTPGLRVFISGTRVRKVGGAQ